MATDISNFGTILAKSICTYVICGGNNNGNGDLELKATNAGNEADAITYTLSKKTDGTGTFTSSLPISIVSNYTGIAKVTASALQNGGQGVVTNKAYNAEIGKFVIDAAAMENATFDVMAGDIVQLFDSVSVNPTIEMYHQPKSALTGEGIVEFENNSDWTLGANGTTFTYGVGGVPMTITRGNNGAAPQFGTYFGLNATQSINPTMFNAVLGQKVTVTIEVDIASLQIATNEYFYSTALLSLGQVAGLVSVYTKSSRAEYSYDCDIPGNATSVLIGFGIVGDTQNTSSVVNVYKWKIDIAPTKKTIVGIAQSSGDRGNTIEVCTRGITTLWAYTGGNTITMDTKGDKGRPTEAMTIAEGAGAIDLTGISRAPYLGIACNDQATITAGASRVDVMLGNVQINI